MKTILRKNVGLFAFSLLATIAFTLVSCQKELTNSKSVQATIDQNASAHVDYVYLVGEEPLEGPDKILAPNGDTLIIMGSGTLSIHAKSATGGGEFWHKDPSGSVLASGTWEAQELLSFKSWGTSADPAFPATFEAGKAFIRIHLSPEGGGIGVNAILQISCVLPGTKHPPAFEEGVRVVIQNVINFNDPVFGQTLFIRQ